MILNVHVDGISLKLLNEFGETDRPLKMGYSHVIVGINRIDKKINNYNYNRGKSIHTKKNKVQGLDFRSCAGVGVMPSKTTIKPYKNQTHRRVPK